MSPPLEEQELPGKQEVETGIQAMTQALEDIQDMEISGDRKEAKNRADQYTRQAKAIIERMKRKEYLRPGELGKLESIQERETHHDEHQELIQTFMEREFKISSEGIRTTESHTEAWNN